MKNIREMIDALRDEISDASHLEGDRAAEIRTELSALQANVMEEYRKREMIYNRKFFEILQKNDVAAKAKVEAQATPEYESMLETRDYKEAVKGMMSSLRLFLRAKEDEYRQTV